MKKVAVVGGGIFGTTAAIFAARAGHDVHVFEELPDLLQAASGINQYRLHRGYHYPRSPHTASSAAQAQSLFRREYGAAVVDSGNHLYAIAKEGSLVSGDQFLAFCDDQGLPYEKVTAPGIVNPGMIEFVIRVAEPRFDPDILRSLVKAKLDKEGITVHLGTTATPALLEKFDKVVIAAYAGTGALMDTLVGSTPAYQYEVCEKPVVALPEAFGPTGLVVMDGPFMCVDPIGTSGRYVLGNVVHAIHSTNIGTVPLIPEGLRPYLNRGLVPEASLSKIGKFLETGTPFIPMLKDAVYLGSFFTVRTVLPNLDATDARPTTVTALDDRYIQIFSRKIGNCVLAAEEVLASL